MKTLVLTALFVLALAMLAWAVFDKGYEAYERVDNDSAAKVWSELAEEGDADAQYRVGVMYTLGRRVPRDFVEAAKWYRKAAEQGHAEAQRSLGLKYAVGGGVPQDYGETEKWFRKAAYRGHGEAQVDLGLLYFHGFGVPRDYVRALQWYILAEAHGNEYTKDYLDQILPKMTQTQISEAQRRAREWMAERGDR